MICPDEIKSVYEEALAKGKKFIDKDFPPELKSLGDVSKFKFGWESAIWLRPG